MYCARSPASRAASRSSVVRRVNCTRCWSYSERTPTSSFSTSAISWSLACLLRLEAGDLLVQLRDALAQLRLLPDPPGGADLEQFGLARHHVLDVGIIGTIEQRRRETRSCRGPAARPASRAARAHSPSRFLVTIARLALVTVSSSRTTHVAGLDEVAVMRAHLADHAAGRMLHLLDAGFDHDRSRRDQRARDLGGRCPAAEAARQQRRPRPAR